MLCRLQGPVPVGHRTYTLTQCCPSCMSHVATASCSLKCDVKAHMLLRVVWCWPCGVSPSRHLQNVMNPFFDCTLPNQKHWPDIGASHAPCTCDLSASSLHHLEHCLRSLGMAQSQCFGGCAVQGMQVWMHRAWRPSHRQPSAAKLQRLPDTPQLQRSMPSPDSHPVRHCMHALMHAWNRMNMVYTEHKTWVVSGSGHA